MNLNKCVTLLATLILVGIFNSSALAGGFDFAQSPKIWNLTGSGDNATSLAKVQVVCPEDGYLVAQGDTGISLLLSSVDFNYVIAGVSITRDNTAPYALDMNHFHKITLDLASTERAVGTPFFIQRVDSCKSGETVNYRLVAWLESAANPSYADHPNLIVQFFNNRI